MTADLKGESERVIDQYRNYMILKGYRPNTVKDRMRCLRDFKRQTGRLLLEATRRDVEAFLARPLAPESRRCYRSHLRAFYAWAVDEGLLAEDPTAKVPAVRVPRGTPRPIDEGDLRLALQLAPRRMRAWLLLMALAGLRACEVARLRPADLIRCENGYLLFLAEAKGGGTATVPAHPDLVNLLMALPVRDGMWWEVTAKTVSTEVAGYLHGIGLKVTGHQLRHYAGTAWYRASGHDLLTTATLLRHANVDTSQVYSKLDPTRPAEVVRLVAMPG